MPRKRRTDEELMGLALKYQTRGAWIKADRASCNVTRNRGKVFFDQCCAHMAAVHQTHTDESLMESALKYQTRGAWKKGDRTSYNAAGRKGKIFLDGYCAHMVAILRTHTDESLMESALKFNARSAWLKGDAPAHRAATRKGKGFFESCCAHMVYTHQTHTDNSLMESALKFTARAKWQKSDSSSYTTALNRGKVFFEKCCSHMVKLHNFLSYQHMMATEKSQATAKGSAPCVVYKIKLKLPCGQSVFKIGYAHSFDARMTDLKKEKVKLVETIAIIQFDNQFDAMTYEHECQTRNDRLGFNAALTKDQKFSGYTECYTQIEHEGVMYSN